jgi:hypothetical protein
LSFCTSSLNDRSAMACSALPIWTAADIGRAFRPPGGQNPRQV